ncbi:MULTISPECIES: hypothetical protein [unclassified Erwinia]|uniref:hypothetical protein n=1 Tax=unclassified Erwinia TaxID=2622719 RepID=UPI00092E5E79|nr:MULTISPECIES: hypothetical protein [unclassified Erwinia]PLV63674.1 hypothetical protein NV64_00005 [Erwinia sp. B116]
MNKKIIIALVFSASMLSGCSALDYKSGTQVSAQQMAQFQKGKTTQDQVVQAIGNPPKKAEVNGKEIWTYNYTKIAGLPLMPNVNESAIFEWSKKGELLNAYKSGGSQGESDNPLLSAAGL